jgi:hypothetical protein
MPARWQTSGAGHDLGVPLHVPPMHWSPFVQALPSSQSVPSFALPVAMQDDWPVAQDVLPVWQTLPPGLHVAPETQGTHCPPLQT